MTCRDTNVGAPAFNLSLTTVQALGGSGRSHVVSEVRASRVYVRPLGVGGQPGVIGVEMSGSRQTAFFINVTGSTISLVLPKSLGRSSVTDISAPPNSQPGWVATDHVTTSTAIATSNIRLAPYSVARLVGGSR